MAKRDTKFCYELGHMSYSFDLNKDPNGDEDDYRLEIHSVDTRTKHTYSTFIGDDSEVMKHPSDTNANTYHVPLTIEMLFNMFVDYFVFPNNPNLKFLMFIPSEPPLSGELVIIIKIPHQINESITDTKRITLTKVVADDIDRVDSVLIKQSDDITELRELVETQQKQIDWLTKSLDATNEKYRVVYSMLLELKCCANLITENDVDQKLQTLKSELLQQTYSAEKIDDTIDTTRRNILQAVENKYLSQRLAYKIFPTRKEVC